MMNNIVMEQTEISSPLTFHESGRAVDLTTEVQVEYISQDEISQPSIAENDNYGPNDTFDESVKNENVSLSNDIDITQLKQKDFSAWDQLYREVSPWLIKYTEKRCREAGCLNEAEDLAQDAIVRLIKRINNYDAQQKSESWKFHLLATIVNNLILDKTKSSRHNRDIVSDSIPDSFDHSTDIESTVINSMEVDRLMAKLPDDQKKLLIERYFYGFTPEELARRTGLKAGLIRGRTTRINSFLRERESAKSSMAEDLK